MISKPDYINPHPEQVPQISLSPDHLAESKHSGISLSNLPAELSLPLLSVIVALNRIPHINTMLQPLQQKEDAVSPIQLVCGLITILGGAVALRHLFGQKKKKRNIDSDQWDFK